MEPTPPPLHPPRGAEECASSHRVHRLLVTFPYASEVGTLITSACDSRAAEVEEEEEKPRMKGAGVGEGRGGGGVSPLPLCSETIILLPSPSGLAVKRLTSFTTLARVPSLNGFARKLR